MIDNKIYVYAHTNHYSMARIVEIAAVNGDGETIFSFKVKPQRRIRKADGAWEWGDVEISIEATEVHGFTTENLANEPTIEQVYNVIYDKLSGEEVVCYSDLTIDALSNSISSFKGSMPKFKRLTIILDEYNDLEDMDLDWGIRNQAEKMGIECGQSAESRALSTMKVYPHIKEKYLIFLKEFNRKKEEQERLAEKRQISRKKTRDKKMALIHAKDGQEMPYFGLDRPDGYITFSKLRISDIPNYEYAGTCCDMYGNKGDLFKPKTEG